MSNPSDAAKKKALELAMSHIVKQFGDGAIMSLGDHSANRGSERPMSEARNSELSKISSI